MSLLDIYTKGMRSVSQRGTGTPMIIAALFTRAKVWKQPKCLSTDEWIKSMCIHTQHKHNGILWTLFQYEKEGNSAIVNNIEGILLSEISQTEKDKYCLASLICRI